MTATQAHDINGPSVLHRRAACPGSARQEEGKPDAGSEAADRGDRLHALAYRVMAEGASLLAEVDAEDADAIAFALERAEEMRGRAGAEARLASELHVDLAGLGILAGGTVDFAFIVPGGPAWAGDYKFGRSWVDHPRWNWQAKAYAWGLREAYGCTEVTFGIAQPAAEDRHRWREVTWSADEVGEIGEAIRRIVAATALEDAPLLAGDHCAFCRARSSCPARAEITAGMVVLRSPLEAMRAMDPSQRRVIYERLAVALEQLGDVRAAIEEEALAGRLEIDGYQIGTGRRSRSWADEAVASAALLRLAHEYGKDPTALVKSVVSSPAEAERILGRSAKTDLEELTVWRDGKPRLTKAKA